MIEYKIYKEEHKIALLEIFRSNCPKYFDPNDENDFIEFLDNYADENYFVVYNQDEIIGCGGHYLKDIRYGIAWTMFKRHSIGVKKLIEVSDAFFSEIENRILKDKNSFDIYVDTTQLMENLFNRYGFKTYEIIKDGFGKGLDEYKMKKTTYNNV
ncbi:acetyltransferase [Tenacibaculum sp. KUL118]|nr:acetyltransferase [Tenacibaculum sp. KUL118]